MLTTDFWANLQGLNGNDAKQKQIKACKRFVRLRWEKKKEVKK